MNWKYFLFTKLENVQKCLERLNSGTSANCGYHSRDDRLPIGIALNESINMHSREKLSIYTDSAHKKSVTKISDADPADPADPAVTARLACPNVRSPRFRQDHFNCWENLARITTMRYQAILIPRDERKDQIGFSFIRQ
jgi:hypothetical protein